jgi:hypothetical protein
MRFSSILVPAVAALALVVAGCGDKVAEPKNVQEGSTVVVAGLDYQVQLSRYLNPNDTEDKYYLRGLPAGSTPDPGKNAVWFAVFMRVKNYSDGTITSTNDFSITDTQGNSFTPIQLDVTKNSFLYQPIAMPHASVNPLPNSAASAGTIGGSEILFKIPVDSLQNRPLILHIKAGSDSAVMQLDL